MIRPTVDNIRARGLRSLLNILLCTALTVTTGMAPAEAKDTPAGQKSTRQVTCMGQSWRLPVVTTSEKGELLVKADQPELMAIARALGRQLTWSGSTLALSGDNGLALTLGEKSLSGRDLPVLPQMLDGAVYMPISALEELLGCRVTVKDGSRGAIYVEPTVRSLSLEEDGSNGAILRVTTTVPVRQKVFKLSNPPRTVIDLIGVAIPKKDPSLEHPALGEIRIAQNQLAPAITRIVIPSPRGVTVLTPKSFDLFEHRAEISWPKGMAAGNIPGRTPTVRITPTSPTAERAPVVKITPTGPTSRPTTPISRPTPPPVVSVGEDPDGRQEPAVATTMSKRPLLLEAKWEGEQLKLVFSQPVTYQWSRLSAGQHRFVVDFPGVVFPAKRQTLTSPVAGLQTVRIVQNMPEPDPIVRMVCDLQGPMAVTTVAGDERELLLEFPGRTVASGGATKGAGQTQKPKPGSVGGRTICLDAGHGGSDPGALNRTYGVSEKQVTLDITLRLAEMLRAEGWNVVMTRTVDRDVSYAGSTDKEELGARSGAANTQRADLFVSIHCNSAANASVGGTSIHWYKTGDYTLAKSLETEVLNATGRSHRGLIKDRFFVLAHTQMPAVLIETAFISNAQEGQLLASPEYREKIARGIAAGLRGYASSHFPLSSAGK